MTAKLQVEPTRWRQASSYAKGADTRQAILQAAIKAFGEAGFNAVTTRQIATMAQVNQPAIAYYFKNKEGLYLACAQQIIDGYAAHLSASSFDTFARLDKDLSPDQARDLLKDVLRALADLMISSKDQSESASFVEREMREPGLAHQYFYDHFWGPGIDVVTRLIGVAKGQVKADEVCRIQAVMLISSFVVFTPSQSVALQAMGWSRIGQDEAEQVLATLDQQIDLMTGAL